jgi:hypothetical protein
LIACKHASEYPPGVLSARDNFKATVLLHLDYLYDGFVLQRLKLLRLSLP